MREIKGLVDERRAAAFLGLSVITLRNYRHLRRGPHYVKLGKAVRYRLEDLVDYVDKRRVIIRET